MIKKNEYMYGNCIAFILIAIMNVSFYNTGRKISMHIMPLGIMYSLHVKQKEVKKHSEVKVILKNDFIDEEEIDTIIDLIRSYKDSSSVSIMQDYRIRFKIHKTIGSEVIYLNKFGDFSYKDKTFKNEKIKKYVFDLLPDYVKIPEY